MGNQNSHQISRLDNKSWIPFTPNPEDRFHHVNTYATRALRNVQTNE